MTTLVSASGSSDPGDDVQHRFRYQHAYGAILIIGMATGKRQGRALWCELHEDYLVELGDRAFEAVQVKTRKPELGEWKLSDEGLAKSIRRFCALREKFGDQVQRFTFVTNAAVREGKSDEDAEESPCCLFRACTSATQISELGTVPLRALTAFAKKHNLSFTVLFDVLHRIALVRGPSLDDFDSVLSHDHLTLLPECGAFGAAQLNALRDEMIHLVYRASSRAVDAPTRHLTCVLLDDARNPAIAHKLIVPTRLISTVLESRRLVFRMLPLDMELKPVSPAGPASPFTKKVEAGGLGFATDTLRRRTLSAESALLEFLARAPEQAQGKINEWAALVKAECDDARLRASRSPAPYGLLMLDLLTERLRERALRTKEGLAAEHDFLMGVAGLLTEACHVWWSEEFPLGAR
ncbi:MAG: DUF4297 domain-containing protein [Planctomycetes bacterium]|nr:DUF4297 domain-containing protein [Planctomycetota bacterium]